ncbi:MAG TPA: response regulator transcription factor [Gemmatimonadota bacterium]|jgi:two-component system KDP operon response regulator KdpE
MTARTGPLILVADDDPVIRRTLAETLEAEGYETLTAIDGVEALDRFQAAAPDLVITDLAMPLADGFKVIREIRRRDRTPIIVLSVRGEEPDKVRALDLGADDYVTKPFSLSELLARIRAQVRRGGGAQPSILAFPGLAIDVERRLVTVEGRDVKLTPTEFAILELLATRAGKPVTIDRIMRRVWRGGVVAPDTVRVHVGSLRRKIEPDPGSPRYIGTEPWIGYRFLPDPLDG